MRETFPVLLGTLVSQTLLNLVALAMLGVIIVSTTPLFHSGTKQLFVFSLVPLILLVVVLVAPFVMRQTGNGRLARIGTAAHRAMVQVRAGLKIFRDPREGFAAAAAQLGAWAIQLSACWALLYALGLDSQAGIGAAAAVLFAVNVTAVVPATPSNIGVFQLAVISVLHTGFGVGTADALAYGVILQGVEIATAVALGLPGPGPRGPHLERPARAGDLHRPGAPRSVPAPQAEPLGSQPQQHRLDRARARRRFRHADKPPRLLNTVVR